MEFEPIQPIEGRSNMLPPLISLTSLMLLTGCKPVSDFIFNTACAGMGVASQFFASIGMQDVSLWFAMQSFTSGCY
jgi:hypothetical protein